MKVLGDPKQVAVSVLVMETFKSAAIVPLHLGPEDRSLAVSCPALLTVQSIVTGLGPPMNVQPPACVVVTVPVHAPEKRESPVFVGPTGLESPQEATTGKEANSNRIVRFILPPL